MQYTTQTKQSLRKKKEDIYQNTFQQAMKKMNTNLRKQSTILESHKKMFPMNLDVNPKKYHNYPSFYSKRQ
jgi:hypothetical protein